ncbi:contact-dependent growth inhibition system immunity protein [Paraburkholderia youngii]|uniref:contact-dependent growth inhibition system immunity protein n=1 Tax=Paraburkholderia youngii TaxID=2782701 RepID=UPI0035A1B6A2
MENQSTYPELNHFLRSLPQSRLRTSGDTIAEVLECYKQGTPVDAHERMLSKIGRLKREHPDPDRAFEETYGQDFSPDLWGRTAASFFEELTRLLSE